MKRTWKVLAVLWIGVALQPGVWEHPTISTNGSVGSGEIGEHSS